MIEEMLTMQGDNKATVTRMNDDKYRTLVSQYFATTYNDRYIYGDHSIMHDSLSMQQCCDTALLINICGSYSDLYDPSLFKMMLHMNLLYMNNSSYEYEWKF